MPRAVNGRKECSKCHEVRDATAKNFAPHKRMCDGLQSWCRTCSRVCVANDYAKNPEKYNQRSRADYEANRERYLEYDRVRNRTPERKVRDKARNTTPERKSWRSDRKRRKWQRSGRGVHMARIQDWREFFDGLATDAERCIAAHVLMHFAAYDDTARSIYHDRDFDYSYIAQHFDLDPIALPMEQANTKER